MSEATIDSMMNVLHPVSEKDVCVLYFSIFGQWERGLITPYTD